MADVNIGQVAATAWEYLVSDGPTDNIMTSQNLLTLFTKGGHQVKATGGRIFEETLQYATNTTFTSIAEMGTVDTTRIPVFDAARFEQRLWVGAVVFSDLEELRNQGDQKIDIVKEKLANGMASSMEGLDGILFGDGTGNGGLDMDGLAKINSTTPSSGTVGQIDPATWVFWRNKATTATKSSTPGDNLLAAMRSIHNQCSLGGTQKRPTGIITDQSSFQIYNGLLTTLERLVKDSGGAAEPDIDWPNGALAFKDIPIGYDEQATSGRMDFVNKRFLKLTILKGAWMKMKDPVEPANMFSRVHRVLTVGNLTTSARRHGGVITAIT